MVRGVIKKSSLTENKEITLVIRPTDGDKMIFYELFERKSLLEPESELWGNNENGIT